MAACLLLVHQMRWYSYTKTALLGGAILLAIDAALVVTLETCNYAASVMTPDQYDQYAHYYTMLAGCTFALSRISYVTHPVANTLYVAIVNTFFDARDRFLHSWSPSTLEVVLYNGLLLSEAFFWGALFSVFAKILFSLLTRFATVSRSSHPEV